MSIFDEWARDIFGGDAFSGGNWGRSPNTLDGALGIRCDAGDVQKVVDTPWTKASPHEKPGGCGWWD